MSLEEKPKTKTAIRVAAMYAKMEEDRIEYVRVRDLKPAQDRFMIAIEFDDFDKVQKFLESGEIDVNHVQAYGKYTPLIRATQFGSARMVELLLKSGGDVHARSDDAWTPLGHFLERMHYGYRTLSARDVEATVNALLLHGSDVNASGRKGQTPLQSAVLWARHSTLVQQLLDNGADISKRNDDEFNALHSVSERRGAASTRNHICKTMLDHVSDYRMMLEITGGLCIKDFNPDRDPDSGSEDDGSDLHTPSELADIYGHPGLVAMLDAAEQTAERQLEEVNAAVRAKSDAQNAENRRQRKTAVAMGLHGRLGADSALLSLGPDILGMIAKHL
jgi:ankyrin repeat protein